MATDLLTFPGEIQMLGCSLKLISKLFCSETQVVGSGCDQTDKRQRRGQTEPGYL